MNIFKALLVTTALIQIGAPIVGLTPVQAQDTRSATALENTGCRPELVSTPTSFPKQSQLGGEHGVVSVNVVVGANGKATSTSVAKSSGYSALDAAAQTSVSNGWLFDVKNCTAADLAKNRTVEVVFKRAPRYTLSATLKPVTVTQQKLRLADNRCALTQDGEGSAVAACVETPTGNVAGRSSELALRESQR